MTDITVPRRGVTGPETESPSLEALLAKLKVTWSYSRRDMLEKCARRYYYEYYGAATPAEPNRAEVNRLKRLKTGMSEPVPSCISLLLLTFVQFGRARYGLPNVFCAGRPVSLRATGAIPSE